MSYVSNLVARMFGLSTFNGMFSTSIYDRKNPILIDTENKLRIYNTIPHLQSVINQLADMFKNMEIKLYDKKTGEYIFYDCSAESPKGRRNVCYDREALESRKEFKPKDTAMDMAAAMGIELLTEEQYRELQELGEFDTKTSSWVKTPSEIRKLGGAIFADRRYNHVFVYHNGAESYYGARGFRGSLKV